MPYGWLAATLTLRSRCGAVGVPVGRPRFSMPNPLRTVRYTTTVMAVMRIAPSGLTTTTALQYGARPDLGTFCESKILKLRRRWQPGKGKGKGKGRFKTR